MKEQYIGGEGQEKGNMDEAGQGESAIIERLTSSYASVAIVDEVGTKTRWGRGGGNVLSANFWERGHIPIFNIALPPTPGTYSANCSRMS